MIALILVIEQEAVVINDSFPFVNTEKQEAVVSNGSFPFVNRTKARSSRLKLQHSNPNLFPMYARFQRPIDGELLWPTAQHDIRGAVGRDSL
jgi:hypothetical protein